MSIIKPFKALRPQPQFTKQVASRPYDVLNSAEAKLEAQGNPYSFLHITKSEIDLKEDTDHYSPLVYQQAKDNLDAFIKREVLFQESKPCYYIYQLIMEGRSQTGLVAVSSVNDYEHNIIKKHEFTRPEKEQDRINHIRTTLAQTGNVFLAYRNNDKIDTIINNWKSVKSPAYDFIADDNIQHTIWVISDSEVIQSISDLFNTEVPCTYIADGHHRAASAAKVKDSMGNNVTESSKYFLTTLFPSNQLHILDYNRVIKDLNGMTEESFTEALAQDFMVEKTGAQALAGVWLHRISVAENVPRLPHKKPRR